MFFANLPSKSTSPTSFVCPVPSIVTRVIPTSMMQAPFFTISALISPGIPVAVIIISACWQNVFNCWGGVKRWHIVTVASIAPVSFRPSACISMNIGKPTFFDRPTTTQFLPNVSIFDRLINSWTPSAVHGINVFISKHKRPTFFSLKPSTSLLQQTASQMIRSLIWFGNGNCTKIPSTSSSSFKSWINANNCSCVMVDWKRFVSLLIPTSAAA